MTPEERIASLFGLASDVVAEAAGRAREAGKSVIQVLLEDGVITDQDFGDAPTQTPAPKDPADQAAGGGLPDLLPGGVRLVEILGKGGMGQVYLAKDEKLDRTVVVKTLVAGLRTGDEFRTRFLREAKAAARLDHPNIVTIHAVGEVDGLPYIVMQHVPGDDLSKHMDQHGPFSVADAVRYACEAARGVGSAHAHGVIHRDLKPANLILGPQGQVKVLDFGTARLDGDMQVTQAGQLIGTIPFMPPEQAEGRDVDARADVYSLGATLYCLLTGHTPFPGDSVVEVLRKVLDNDMAPLAAACPGLPDAVYEFVHGAMSKDPADRPQTAEEFVAQLEAIDLGGAVASPSASQAAASPSSEVETHLGAPVDTSAEPSTTFQQLVDSQAETNVAAQPAGVEAPRTPPAPQRAPTVDPRVAATPKRRGLLRTAAIIIAVAALFSAVAVPQAYRAATLRAAKKGSAAEQTSKLARFLKRYPGDESGMKTLGELRGWSLAQTQRPLRNRVLHQVAFDPLRNHLVLFGGSDQVDAQGEPSSPLGDTWVWQDDAWTERAGAGPAPRVGHAMVFHTASGRLLLFGGVSRDGSQGDTWTWDGDAWTRLDIELAPPARAWHSLAYDSKREVAVLYGGAQGKEGLTDTWEWTGAAWRSVPAVRPPPKRGYMAMGYDATRGVTVLFGGENEDGFLGDTWTWDGSAWSEASPASTPSPRSTQAMAWDPESETLVLFGGVGAEFSVKGISYKYYDDTWEWDGETWSERRPARRPPARGGHAMAWDPTRKQVVMVAGLAEGGKQTLEDVWYHGSSR